MFVMGHSITHIILHTLFPYCLYSERSAFPFAVGTWTICSPGHNFLAYWGHEEEMT